MIMSLSLSRGGRVWIGDDFSHGLKTTIVAPKNDRFPLRDIVGVNVNHGQSVNDHGPEISRI